MIMIIIHEQVRKFLQKRRDENEGKWNTDECDVESLSLVNISEL